MEEAKLYEHEGVIYAYDTDEPVFLEDHIGELVDLSTMPFDKNGHHATGQAVIERNSFSGYIVYYPLYEES